MDGGIMVNYGHEFMMSHESQTCWPNLDHFTSGQDLAQVIIFV